MRQQGGGLPRPRPSVTVRHSGIPDRKAQKTHLLIAKCECLLQYVYRSIGAVAYEVKKKGGKLRCPLLQEKDFIFIYEVIVKQKKENALLITTPVRARRAVLFLHAGARESVVTTPTAAQAATHGPASCCHRHTQGPSLAFAHLRRSGRDMHVQTGVGVGGSQAVASVTEKDWGPRALANPNP